MYNLTNSPIKYNAKIGRSKYQKSIIEKVYEFLFFFKTEDINH